MRARRTRTGSRAGRAPTTSIERPALSAAEFDDQLRWRGRPRGRVREIDAALEAKAGIGGEAQSARLALDHRGIPERAFEEDARRGVADGAVLRRP